VDINVLQGEREMARDNRSLGKFRLDGIPPASRGTPQIEVTFDIDANGILNVNAKEKATGKEQKITISGSSNLSKGELDRMMDEAKTHSAEDKKRREEAEVRNNADSLAYQVEKQLSQFGSSIPVHEKARIDQLVTDLRQALKENVDIIGLSGLITPSLEEMVHVAEEMQRRNVNIPLLVGGATTSKIHTAIKIAPAVEVPAIYVKDASKSVGVVRNLLSTTLKQDFLKGIIEEYRVLREQNLAAKSGKTHIALEQARKNKVNIDWDRSLISKPTSIGNTTLTAYPLKEIAEYIDWTFFFHAWEINGKYPKIFDDPVKGEEAKKLYDDAQKMLKQIIDNKMLTANAVFGLYPANAVGDDIELYEDEKREKVVNILHHLRNQQIKEEGEFNACLSDFIAPKNSGINDYIE